MIRILAILQCNHFDGVLIPDHTPQMTCSAPWHAGMAHTLGFMLAAKAMIESSQSHGIAREPTPFMTASSVSGRPPVEHSQFPLIIAAIGVHPWRTSFRV